MNLMGSTEILLPVFIGIGVGLLVGGVIRYFLHHDLFSKSPSLPIDAKANNIENHAMSSDTFIVDRPWDVIEEEEESFPLKTAEILETIPEMDFSKMLSITDEDLFKNWLQSNP